ncbi:site-specific integrase [uncultured Mitsuokella sp.]|uniref:tyrosine-type recombinase/integrase n=1 Tax=uncultured Mitsuokella sp. TaxID=453120 RepID=UPI0025DE34E2|nr:site-specific integrase [uncultured Mitsuokella sp.]
MAKIRTRKRGKTWSYSFEIGKDPASGKRKMKEKGGFESQDAAYDAGVEAYANWKHGNIGITSERVTVNDFFASWIEHVVRPNVTRGTYQQYESRYRTAIAPYVGAMYMQDVKPRDVDRIVRDLAAKGKSHETILNTLTVLKTMMKYAVYPAELIPSNPAASISIPKSAPVKVLERRVISKEEFAAVLERFVGKRYPCRMPVLLGYYAGLRIGEALGLCWTDIDFEKKCLVVERQLRPGNTRHEFYFDPPKTPTSRRTIYLSSALLDELRAWRKWQQENRLRLGSAYQITYQRADHSLSCLPLVEKTGAEEMHLVCTDEYGLPVKRDTLMYRLRHLGINFHSLRHTHATRLIEAGAKPVDVAARLGHADVSLTENLYSHDTEKMARETAELVDKVM